MLRNTIATLLLLPFAAGLIFAQGPHTSMTTMVCKTSDGVVRISDHNISLADYDLRFDSVVRDGVFLFTDNASGVEALLDVREDQGLYLLVSEPGNDMQVVASRSNISYEQSERGTEPATPAFSSILNMVRASSRGK
ncbi:MAG: hypothetical protein KFH87_13095 [Bacteroidetes bacterium]|nr:hypothetical protein [Bacteroidota bacterium]